MGKLVHFNLEHRPFVYLEFQNIPITDENFEEYKREYLELLFTCKQKSDKIIPIINVNSLPILPIQYILKQKQLNQELFQIHKKYLECVYIYCESKIFKELIHLNMFIEKTAVPIHICRSVVKMNRSIQSILSKTFDTKIFISQKNNSSSLIE